MKCEKCGFDKDRIINMKKELTKLYQKVQEAEIAYQTTKENLELMQKVNSSSTKNSAGQQKLFREQIAKQLDALRLRVDLIRKFSPESAEILEKIINDYEKGNREFFEIVKEKSENLSGWQILSFFISFTTEILGMSKKIDDIVKVPSYAIRDTLKRLES